MDRIKYQEVLESIKIPDGMTQEEMLNALKPLNIALLQMIPKRLYKYRSCKDEHISAFEKMSCGYLLLIYSMTHLTH